MRPSVVRFAIPATELMAMADAILQQCPICKSEAKALQMGDVLSFACPKPEHDKFKVSDAVYAVPNLWNSDTKRWEAALKTAKARTQPGEWPTITSYDFPSALSS